MNASLSTPFLNYPNLKKKKKIKPSSGVGDILWVETKIQKLYYCLCLCLVDTFGNQQSYAIRFTPKFKCINYQPNYVWKIMRSLLKAKAANDGFSGRNTRD